MIIKHCACGIQAKTMSEVVQYFHKDPSKSYGFSNICKKCKNKKTAAYNLAHHEKSLATQKKYREKRKQEKLDKKT